ncbi:MAG TPA: carboxypeptidase-like regulatory domain-containing protein [Vicinamibacterales bacterium]|nr:carboxypeptidase-like regulatory domain-containing protein [Vicinamibacterales bacterium]
MTHRTAAAMVVLLMLSGGCAARHGRPVVGGSVIPNPTGTISGTVRSTSGIPLEGRRVSAISMTTEAHFDTMTEKNGGYTIKVPPGRYRLEVELRGGDQLASQPDPFNVNVGDLDAQMDVVVGR